MHFSLKTCVFEISSVSNKVNLHNLHLNFSLFSCEFSAILRKVSVSKKVSTRTWTTFASYDVLSNSRQIVCMEQKQKHGQGRRKHGAAGTAAPPALVKIAKFFYFPIVLPQNSCFCPRHPAMLPAPLNMDPVLCNDAPHSPNCIHNVRTI